AGQSLSSDEPQKAQKKRNTFAPPDYPTGKRNTRRNSQANTNPCKGKKRGLGIVWRWCERLDGSGDLYRDSETSMEHMARIVRRDGLFHLAKPVLHRTWETREKAERGVRKLLKEQRHGLQAR